MSEAGRRGGAPFDRNPAVRRIVGFGLATGFGSAVAVAADEILAGRSFGLRTILTVTLFGTAAGIAAMIAWPLAGWVCGRRAAAARFSAMVLLLSLGTIGLAGILFVAQRLPLFDIENAPAFSRAAIGGFVWSCLSALGLFAGTGPRLFLPSGLAILAVAGIVFARNRR